MAAFTIKDIQAILKALRYDDKTTRHKTLIDSGNKNKLTIIGENQVTEINTICPVCEKDITITEHDIQLAVQHKQDTGGNVLVTCPECCRALVVPNVNETDITEWVISIAQRDDWNGCVPMLDDTEIRKPSGSRGDLGVLEYIPGNGGPALRRHAYMFTYGIDPACHMAKNPGTGGKPFVIGGKQ